MSLRRVAGAAFLFALAACTPLSVTGATLKGQTDFHMLQMGPAIGYLIDPRTETCVLTYGAAISVAVSCAKLKRNLPDAAPYITWDEAPAIVPHP